MLSAGVLAVLLAGCSAAERSTGTPDAGAQGASTAPAVAPAGGRATSSAPASSTRAAPPATPCTRNRRARWVFVSLRRQHLWMCAGSRVERDTPITSGMAGPAYGTPTGTFRIQGLNRNSVLTLADGEQFPVKYWIPFQAPLFGFHDSPWQTIPYGSPQYRTKGSHGCVHVPLASIKHLYRWAAIGTPVTIRA